MSSIDGLHQICHVEIQVSDLDRSRAFYQSLFGWDFRAFFPDMDAFGVGEHHIGGLMKVDHVVPGQSPSIWIKVQNVDESLAKAVSLGASVQEPKGEVPHVGWSAVFADPDGTPIGVVQYL